jgi:hypothetical protein
MKVSSVAAADVRVPQFRRFDYPTMDEVPRAGPLDFLVNDASIQHTAPLAARECAIPGGPAVAGFGALAGGLAGALLALAAGWWGLCDVLR